MIVQSILFDKKLFTPKKAIMWLKKHKYKYSKIDIKPNHLRFRQTTPKKGDEYRTKKLGNSGIELILEMPKLSGGANHTEQIKLFNEILKHLIYHITSGEFDKLDVIQSKKLINELNKLKGGSFNDLSEDDRLRLYNDLLKYANPDDARLEMLMKKYKENYTSNRIGSTNTPYHINKRKEYFDEFKNITIPKIKEHNKNKIDRTLLFNYLSEDDRLRLYNDLLKYPNPDDARLEMLMKKYRQGYIVNSLSPKANKKRKEFFDEFKNITVPKIIETYQKPEIKKSFKNPKLDEMYDKYLKITHSDDSYKVIMTKLKPIFNYVFDIKNITEEEQKLFKEMITKDEEALNKTGKEQFKKYLDIPASQPFRIATFNPIDKLSKEEYDIYIKLFMDYNKKNKEKGESAKINKINKFIKDKDINQLKKLSKEYLYEIFNNKDKPIEKYTKDKLIDEILKKEILPVEKPIILKKSQLKNDIQELINKSNIPIKKYDNNNSVNDMIKKIDNLLLSKKPAPVKKPQVKINKSVLMRKLKPELIKMAKEQNKNLTDDLTKLKKDDIIDKYILNNPEDYKKEVEGYQVKAIDRIIKKLNTEGDDYLPYAQSQFIRRPKIFLETFQKLHPDILKQIFSYNPDKLKKLLSELKEKKPEKEKKPKKEKKLKEEKPKKDVKPKKEVKSKNNVIDELARDILNNVNLTPFSVDFKGDSETKLSNTFSFDFDNSQKDEFSKKYEDLLLLLLKNVIPRYDIYEKYKSLL
jgi:hypothetical protein